MEKFRFIKFQEGKKWYALSLYGYISGQKRNEAKLFDNDDWRLWGERDGWTKEPLGEDQPMRLHGAQPLPGFEL